MDKKVFPIGQVYSFDGPERGVNEKTVRFDEGYLQY